MIAYPQIDPVAFHIVGWPVHWYGIMYLFAFFCAWMLLLHRLNKKTIPLTKEQLSDVIFFGAIGVIAGGRIGYMFFYNFPELLHKPWTLFATWQGGMSFHGGLIGVLIAMGYCAYRFRVRFLALTDFIAPVVPIGLGLGRLGNFINGELWGRSTNVPWAMQFPHDALQLWRHPSQLYEFFLEGVVLFLLLWWFSGRPRPLGAVSGLFVLGYGLFRSLAECFREPDIQIGYLAKGWLTEGQLLSLPLIVLGVVLLALAYRSLKKVSS